MSQATIENIERGRKPDPAVSDLLNLAWTLRVPLSYLLAPLYGGAHLDIPNLAPEIAALSPAEFDAWLAGTEDGAYRARDSSERASIAELSAYRQLHTLHRERHRLEIINDLDPNGASSGRLKSVLSQIRELESYLGSTGWSVS